MPSRSTDLELERLAHLLENGTESDFEEIARLLNGEEEGVRDRPGADSFENGFLVRIKQFANEIWRGFRR